MEGKRRSQRSQSKGDIKAGDYNKQRQSVSDDKSRGRRGTCVSTPKSAKKFSVLGEDSSLAYRVLNAEQTNAVLAACASNDVNQLQQYIEDVVLQLTDAQFQLEQSIIIDYYVSAMWWAAREQNFTGDQVSAFFTVCHMLLDNIRTGGMSSKENLCQLRKLMVGVGLIELPDGCVAGGLQNIFNTQQMQLVTDYLYTSVFQHYELYTYLFTADVDIQIQKDAIALEVPTPDHAVHPPPLCEAVSLDNFQQFIRPSPAEDDEVEEEQAVEEDLSEREVDLLSRLTPDVVCQMIDQVFTELVAEFHDDVKTLIADRSGELLKRINVMYKLK